MRREALTLLVMIGFSLSLLATSKAPPSKRTGDAASASPEVGATPDATSVDVELPDTSTWKPYSFPEGKLTAKTPPGAMIRCTKTGDIVVCVVMRGRKLIGTFSKGGSTVAEMADEMRTPEHGQFKILLDAPNAFVIHRDDPTYGSFCEYAAQGPATLRSAFSLVDRQQNVDVFKMIALEDADCLDAVAFARTLRIGP